MAELQPGDRVQYFGLDGILRDLHFTLIEVGDLYTTLRDDCGGERKILNSYVRKVEQCPTTKN
jgi:hypothetical protein